MGEDLEYSQKALAMAMCSIVEITGIVNRVGPIALVISIKSYVTLLKEVLNGGRLNFGNPELMVPAENVRALFIDIL